MVLADMANPPEHDFAPAWLKIPSHQQQSSKPPHVNYNSQSGRLGHLDDKYRSRQYSTDSQYDYGRSPTHEQFGFRGRDERRNYSNPAARHHSVDDLPWDPDPTTNWNYSQFNGNSSPTYGTGYPRRGSSVPRNGQQYSSNGRFDGSGFTSTRGQFHQGKPAGPGRQRYNSGPKSGYTEREDHPIETTSKKEEGQGDGAEETGKEGDNTSALSNQDFPSLSGAGDDVEPSVTAKTSVPSGAWEKPPGTTRIISGRKVQLVKKSIPSSSESKSPRTVTPSSTATVDTNSGSKVGGQTVPSSQSSKVTASSNVSSSVVLKSMTSVTAMVSSRSKEPAIRSTPAPTNRISPVPSKPSPVPVTSRSTPITIKPSTTPINKTPISKVPVNKLPINTSPVNKKPIPQAHINNATINKSPINKSPINKPNTPTSTRSPFVSATTSVSTEPIQHAPVTSRVHTSAVKSTSSSSAKKATSASVKSMPVLVNSSKVGPPTQKSASTPTKPTAITNMSGSLTLSKPPSVNKMAATMTPNKTTVVTNMSAVLTSNKPSSITNMSSPISNRPSPTPNRLTSAPSRLSTLNSRSAPVFPRPSPVPSNRQTPVAIINRPIQPPMGSNGSAPSSLRSGLASCVTNRKEKSVIPVHASTLQHLTKEPPTPLPNPTSSVDVTARSPTTLKPKKGDKMDFLNELRRSSNGDLSKEVSQNNQDNLRGMEECVWRKYGPSSTPKTILQREHDIKTNGLDIHNDLTNIEKGFEEVRVPNFYPVFTPVSNVPDMSSSLEAERRLLQEMGWHEHSDNEEGYAPLTEEELKEFQKRSQQLKRNGLTRALPTAWNSVSLPIGSIAQVSLEDGFTSSDSDSSDDDQS